MVARSIPERSCPAPARDPDRAHLSRDAYLPSFFTLGILACIEPASTATPCCIPEPDPFMDVGTAAFSAATDCGFSRASSKAGR
jgi:hypothetical protein